MDNAFAAWLPEAVRRINYLVSVQATSFAPESLRAIVRMLADPIWEGTPSPMLGPAGEGGLAVEFRGRSVELQIEVDGEGNATAYAAQRGVTEWEGPFDELPDGIEKWAWRLAQDSV